MKDLTKKAAPAVSMLGSKQSKTQLLQPGRIIRPNEQFLRPGERQILEQSGWQPGEPVPDNLSEAVEMIRQEASDPNLMPPPVDPSTPPLVIPDEVPIEQLDPQQQQSILSSAMAYARQAAQQNATIGALPPSVAAAVRVSSEPDERPEQKPATVTPEPAEEPGGFHSCPRCGFNKNNDDFKPTEEDKDEFINVLLDVFRKEYVYFGNRLRIKVRTLRPPEVQALWQQLRRDMGSGRLSPNDTPVMLLNRYRTALQIEEISLNGSPIAILPKTLTEWRETLEDNEQRSEDWVRHVTDRFFSEALNTESLERIAIMAVERFNMLVLVLELQAANPDFYKAIDGE